MAFALLSGNRRAASPQPGTAPCRMNGATRGTAPAVGKPPCSTLSSPGTNDACAVTCFKLTDVER